MRDLLENLRSIDPRKKFIFLAVVIGIVFLIILVVGIIGLGKTPEDRKVSEKPLASEPAVISNGGNLFSLIGSETRYLNLRNDLTRLGNKQYSIKANEVVFSLKGSPSSDNQDPATITFSGAFDKSSKNILRFTINLLPNNRMKIHATANNKDLSDDLFDSNSKRNIFIATLPLDKGDYTITYLENTNEFVIQLFVANPDLLATSLKDLEDGLGTTDVSNEKYSYTYPTAVDANQPAIQFDDAIEDP